MPSKNGPSREEMLPLLLETIDGDDPDERYQALSELADWERVPDAAIDPLLALLALEDDDLRRAAIEALAKTGSERILEPLLDLLEDLKVERRHWVRNQVFHAAIAALGRCGVGDARVVAMLINNVQTLPEVERKTSSFDALRALGPAAKAAIPALEALLATGEEWEQTYAHATLYAIDGKLDAHLPAIVAALGSKTKGESVKGVALLSLLAIGEPALPTLDAAAKGKGKPAKAAKELAEMLRSRK